MQICYKMNKCKEHIVKLNWGESGRCIKCKNSVPVTTVRVDWPTEPIRTIIYRYAAESFNPPEPLPRNRFGEYIYEQM